jgi:hypothetical protein
MLTATITETIRLSPHRSDTVVVRPPSDPGPRRPSTPVELASALR